MRRYEESTKKWDLLRKEDRLESKKMSPHEILEEYNQNPIIYVRPRDNFASLDNIRALQEEYSIIVRRRLSNGNTRPRYRLENELKLELSNGDTLNLYEHFSWDLSSVPRLLWGILPPDGNFETASLIHDFIYVNKTHSRKFADKEMLKWSMAAAGTKNKISLRNIDNYIRYYAVRIFGWIVWNKRKKK